MCVAVLGTWLCIHAIFSRVYSDTPADGDITCVAQANGDLYQPDSFNATHCLTSGTVRPSVYSDVQIDACGNSNKPRPTQKVAWTVTSNSGQVLHISYTVLAPSRDDPVQVCYVMDRTWHAARTNITCWVPVPSGMEAVRKFTMTVAVTARHHSTATLGGYAQVDVKHVCADHCEASRPTITQPNSTALTARVSVAHTAGVWLSLTQNVTHTCQTASPIQLRAECEIDFTGVQAGGYVIEILTRSSSTTGEMCRYRAYIHVPICRAGCTFRDSSTAPAMAGPASVTPTNGVIIPITVGALTIVISVTIVVFIFLRCRSRSHDRESSTLSHEYSVVHVGDTNNSESVPTGTGEARPGPPYHLPPDFYDDITCINGFIDKQPPQ